MNIYEMHGRQAEQLRQVTDAFAETLALLRQLRDGEVSPSALVVSENGWTLKEEGSGNEESSPEGRVNGASERVADVRA